MPRRPQHPVVDRGPDFGTSSRSRTLEPPSRHRRSQRRFPFPIAAARTTSPPSTCPGTARNRKFLQQNPGRVADLCPPRSHMPRPHPPTARPAPAARLARRPLPLTSTGARPSRQDAFPVQSAESTRQRPHDGSPPLPSHRLNLPSTCCSRSIRQGCPGHPDADGNYLAVCHARQPADLRPALGCSWQLPVDHCPLLPSAIEARRLPTTMIERCRAPH